MEIGRVPRNEANLSPMSLLLVFNKIGFYHFITEHNRRALDQFQSVQWPYD